MHQQVDIGSKFVYIVMHRNSIVNVYNEYMDAVLRAVSEVSSNPNDPNDAYIESHEHLVWVEGDKGLMSIVVEQLY